jgi:hypothetical protein
MMLEQFKYLLIEKVCGCRNKAALIKLLYDSQCFVEVTVDDEAKKK